MGKMLATTYIYCKNEMSYIEHLVEFLAQCKFPSSGRPKNDGSTKSYQWKEGGKLLSVGNLIRHIYIQYVINTRKGHSQTSNLQVKNGHFAQFNKAL